MKLKNNLYLLSGGVYGQLGNVLAVKHEEGCFLVDCGNPGSFHTIVENLNYWGLSEREVTHVLLTHGHDDHAGTSNMFQKLGAEIVVGKEDSYMLRQGNFGKESPFANHQMPCCEPDTLIDKDTHLSIGGVEIDVFAMPGHTNGTRLYYVYADNERILFSGDMFNCDGEKGDIARTWWMGDMNYDGKKLGESFARLWAMDLNPTVIIGGHGNPRMGDQAKDLIMTAYKYYLLNHR